MTRDLAPEKLAAARKLAPKMDETSLAIFAGSRFFSSIAFSLPERPTSHKGTHYDVTGVYQRRKRSKP